MYSENGLQDNASKKRVPWYAYLTLFLTTLFLSGLLTKVEGPLSALDFTNVLGSFGKLGTVGKDSGVILASNFKGIGGIGVQDGFLLIANGASHTTYQLILEKRL